MQTAPEWSDDDLARLKELVAEGLSGGQIARMMGRTRNSIVGKAHRKGYKFKGSPGNGQPRQKAPKPPPAPKPPKEPKGPKVRTLAISGMKAPGSTRPYLPIPEPVLTGNEPTVVDLGRGCCKWPVGEATGADQRFCGVPTDGRYCEAHEAKSYRAYKAGEDE